jgi:gamma-aminobutyric acid type B receptor
MICFKSCQVGTPTGSLVIQPLTSGFGDCFEAINVNYNLTFAGRTDPVTISEGVFNAIVIFAGIDIALAVLLIALNCIFRKHPQIRPSSPNVNALILVGCIIALCSTFVAGDSGTPLPGDCQGMLWLASLGISVRNIGLTFWVPRFIRCVFVSFLCTL